MCCFFWIFFFLHTTQSYTYQFCTRPYWIHIIFAHGPIEYVSFLNKSIRSIDGTLTGTYTSGQSEPESDDNDRVSQSFYSSRTGATPRRGVLTHCRRYSQRILSSRGSAKWKRQHISQRSINSEEINWYEVSSKLRHQWIELRIRFNSSGLKKKRVTFDTNGLN